MRLHQEFRAFRWLLVGLIVAAGIGCGLFLAFNPVAIADPSNSTAVGWAQGGLATLAIAGVGTLVVIAIGRSQAAAALASAGYPYPELALSVAFLVSGPRLIRSVAGRGLIAQGADRAPGAGLDMVAASKVAARLHRRMVLSLIPFLVELVVVLPVLGLLLVSSPAWFTPTVLTAVILVTLTLASAVGIGQWLFWRAADREELLRSTT